MHQSERSQRSGCIVAGQLVVLDRNSSRYLLVPGGAREQKPTPEPHAGQSVLLTWDGGSPLLKRTARETWVYLPKTAAAPEDGKAGLLPLCRLRWFEWKAATRLRRSGLAAGLRLLDHVDADDPDLRAQARLVSAAWRSRRLWSDENQCLPRSIALASALRQEGGSAKLVIGVTLQPFAAHAWVQDGTTVLNDTIDHVTLFKPILVA